MRGGLQLAPLNQSSVYFSTNNYANHAAINASWNLLHSLMSSGSSGVNPYHYLPAGRVKAIVDSLYAGKDNAPHLIRYTEGNPVNVILVVWESFTHKALDRSEGEKPVMPRFNSLIQEGIYFSQVYASGDRTNKGLPALLSGYPSLPKTTVIHSPSKSQKLQVLSRLFAGKGYSTSFFYGGEPEFANIKSYLLFGGFDPIIGKGDFTQSDMNSKWGAHDGVVKDKVLAELNKQKKPFFATWLTLSSHEPFETPEKVVIEGKSNTSRFLNSLHYTDKVLGEFIDECKRQEWWKNTVIIVTGDHGHPLPETTSKADDFRIPMLWLGGALDSTGLVINTVLSQVDLASTLAFQVGLPGHQFPFSRNALVSGDRKWAFFTFNDGFGFIDSSGRLLYDNVGRRPIKKEGHTGYAQEESGKALMQWIYDDFLRK